jgi:hypothetical protein
MPASAGLVALAVMGGATERLECEREYNTQMAAAEAKRKAAGGSGSDGVPPA